MKTLTAVLALLAATVIPSGQKVAAVPDTRMVPVATAPGAQVTTELGLYAAFPAAVALPDGSGYLMTYKISNDHWGAGSSAMRIRRSADGLSWSDTSAPTTGAGYGVTGLAAEPQALGGRIYMAQMDLDFASPTSQTLVGITPYLRFSDNGGVTWSPLVVQAGGGVRSPATAPQTWTFYSSSLAVLADGTVLMAGYGGVDGHGTVRRSTDRGATWTADADFAPPAGRTQVLEPQLCALADGRVVALLRSDAGTSQRLYMAIRETSGTWGAQRVITYDGSGAPACAEISPGFIAYVYRGWSDRSSEDSRPMRIGAMGVNPSTWGRGNIALDDQQRRFLYGTWIRKGPEGSRDWIVIHAVEGPNGPTAPSATVWATPVTFRDVP